MVEASLEHHGTRMIGVTFRESLLVTYYRDDICAALNGIPLDRQACVAWLGIHAEVTLVTSMLERTVLPARRVAAKNRQCCRPDGSYASAERNVV